MRRQPLPGPCETARGVLEHPSQRLHHSASLTVAQCPLSFPSLSLHRTNSNLIINYHASERCRYIVQSSPNSGNVICYILSLPITYRSASQSVHYNPRNPKNQRVRTASVSLLLHLINAGLPGSAPRCLSRGPERLESANTSTYGICHP